VAAIPVCPVIFSTLDSGVCGRNQRLRRALLPASSEAIPRRAAPQETTAKAIAALETQRGLGRQLTRGVNKRKRRKPTEAAEIRVAQLKALPFRIGLENAETNGNGPSWRVSYPEAVNLIRGVRTMAYPGPRICPGTNSFSNCLLYRPRKLPSVPGRTLDKPWTNPGQK
jgi:hypothetical protein